MPLLDFSQTKQLLQKHQIPTATTNIVETFEEANVFAKKNSYPVVLKNYSTELIHKTEQEAIQNNIQNQEELEQSFSFLKNNFEGKILIQPQIEGYEIIIGMQRDPSFGTVIMVGFGGIFTEIFQDTAFRIAPVYENDAQAMLKELQIYPLLIGYRKKEAANIEQLSNFIVKVSELAEKENICEIDFNPVIANSEETLVVDPKIYL